MTEHTPTQANHQPAPMGKIESQIIELARRHNVTYTKTSHDNLAETITRLSGDDVEMDDVELLLIALQRANVITRAEALPLHVNYLHEKLNVRSI